MREGGLKSWLDSWRAGWTGWRGWRVGGLEGWRRGGLEGRLFQSWPKTFKHPDLNRSFILPL